MKAKYATSPAKDNNWTQVRNERGELVALHKNNFVALIGKHSTETLSYVAQAIERDIKQSTLIFPGNSGHHTDKTTLFSHKAGGGLAALASACYDKLGSATLSLPTVMYGANQAAVKDRALIDFWRVVGLGELVMLPVRKFQSFDRGQTKFFSKSLFTCDQVQYEPSFWGVINMQADTKLANSYLGHLNEGINILAHNDTSLVDGLREKLVDGKPKPQNLNDKYLNPYLEGRSNAQKPVEERDPWYRPAPKPTLKFGIESGNKTLDTTGDWLDPSSSSSEEPHSGNDSGNKPKNGYQ